MGSKRKREEEDMAVGEIVWQTPANPPQRSDYILLNGRRHVRPYYFEFIAHVKNRWAGKTIVDLFAEEFKGRPYEYYIDAVKCGRIQVDGELVPVSYIVRSSQKISHFLHRHEPPVMACDVKILKEEADVLTVCKPASVPVHPCGQYRKNTVVGILQAEHGLAPLFPIHRLDRLVSGLLILARNSSKADLFRQQIESGLVKKQYIARVVGVFPEKEQLVDVNINYNAREGRSTAEMVDSCSDARTKGKTAQTKFTRISSDGIHSIVLCEPITGRTHQIRVHLQYSGYPIANDALYLTKEASCRSVERTNADRAAAHCPARDTEEDCVDGCKEKSDTRETKRVYGCIVFGILDQDGSTNAHIQNGLHFNTQPRHSLYLLSMLQPTVISLWPGKAILEGWVGISM
ncbi:RNA pseudouridine synthase 7 isoform X2 [Momordica charantia]|uniref:Pseudouridine synthase n=1 Tax=Momordica charantia TaxID=3673 RepID=A0A6J1BZC9_MOMCH|nr:RNA pseudouridine synthase 7 isoform X2 [Momordica charantia]